VKGPIITSECLFGAIEPLHGEELVPAVVTDWWIGSSEQAGSNNFVGLQCMLGFDLSFDAFS